MGLTVGVFSMKNDKTHMRELCFWENERFVHKIWAEEKRVFIQFKDKNWKVKGLNRWYVELCSKEITAIQSCLKQDIKM